jgi:hypothetical protein
MDIDPMISGQPAWRSNQAMEPRLINLGVADKGGDCERVEEIHHWYNIDGVFSGWPMLSRPV